MITNKDLTPHQVALLSLSLNHEIDRLDQCLTQSVKLGITENVEYYSKRKNETEELREILRNTIGMKREIC